MEKMLIGFVIIKELPLFNTGNFYELYDDDTIRSDVDWELAYWSDQCLSYPAFFEPIYSDSHINE